MIKWVDILSPQLRQIHQDWMYYRGYHLMPSVAEYNPFASAEMPVKAEASSATVILPIESGPVFRHVGRLLTEMMPECRGGTKFTELLSPFARSAIAAPFHRVATSRQPESRRMRSSVPGTETQNYEMLLLPFSDQRLRVCIIHAVYDLAGINWKKAFA